MARTLTSTDAAPGARHLLVMEVGKEARKDPVPHGTPADQYLTKKYFGASDVLFQMVPMPDGSSIAPRVPRQREHAGYSCEHLPPLVCGSVSESLGVMYHIILVLHRNVWL